MESELKSIKETITKDFEEYVLSDKFIENVIRHILNLNRYTAYEARKKIEEGLSISLVIKQLKDEEFNESVIKELLLKYKSKREHKIN